MTTVRKRFSQVLNFEKPDDRLPMIEWAPWWNETLERWKQEGLPQDLSFMETLEYFELDPLICLNASARSGECPDPPSHGAPIIDDEKDYEDILPYLYTDSILEKVKEEALSLKERHDRGEIIIRLWLDGFFWFPRTLFGIEEHLMPFMIRVI